MGPPSTQGGINKQTKIEYELTNLLVGLFDSETLKRADVLKKATQNIKIVRDQFRVHLERNPRYERPPMILAREWKDLVEDGNERDLRKEGKLPSVTGRYAILSAM